MTLIFCLLRNVKPLESNTDNGKCQCLIQIGILWFHVGLIHGQRPLDLVLIGGSSAASAFVSWRDRGIRNSLCGQLAYVHIRNVDWHRGAKPEIRMIRHAAKQLDYRLFWLHHITHLKINLRLAATRRQYAMKQQNADVDKYRIWRYTVYGKKP